MRFVVLSGRIYLEAVSESFCVSEWECIVIYISSFQLTAMFIHICHVYPHISEGGGHAWKSEVTRRSHSSSIFLHFISIEGYTLHLHSPVFVFRVAPPCDDSRAAVFVVFCGFSLISLSSLTCSEEILVRFSSASIPSLSFLRWTNTLAQSPFV